MTRRHFLRVGSGVTLSLTLPVMARTAQNPRFQTRGVVLIPEDLSWTQWPERAAEAGLTTVALHHGRSLFEVVKFVHSEAGQEFLRKAHKHGLQVEYELHAMNELLPRWWFDDDPALFRMNEQGTRVRDGNLCVHSPRVLDLVAENATAVARLLRPTTGRYFYWGDDGMPWCRCPKCREFSDSDQALLLENHLAQALRRSDSLAQVAHLAYAHCLTAPSKIRPISGVFLEYAPIRRRYDLPYANQQGGADSLTNLDANLKVFPARTAQVLEYWLDVSRFSGWKRPAQRLPWNREVLVADLEAYASRGIRHVTSFACYIDAEYLKRYGEPSALQEYGAALKAG